MIIGLIVFLVLLFLGMYVIFTSPEDDKPTTHNINAILDLSEELHTAAEKYKQLETALIDLDTIDNEHLRGIQLTIPSLSQHETEYTMIVGEGEQLDALRHLILTERSRVYEELCRLADKIGDS